MGQLKQIKQMQTVINNTHESVYRSYNVLEKVKQMLKRGDSTKTVLEIVEYLTEEGNNCIKDYDLKNPKYLIYSSDKFYSIGDRVSTYKGETWEYAPQDFIFDSDLPSSSHGKYPNEQNYWICLD